LTAWGAIDSLGFSSFYVSPVIVEISGSWVENNVRATRTKPAIELVSFRAKGCARPAVFEKIAPEAKSLGQSNGCLFDSGEMGAAPARAEVAANFDLRARTLERNPILPFGQPALFSWSIWNGAPPRADGLAGSDGPFPVTKPATTPPQQWGPHPGHTYITKEKGRIEKNRQMGSKETKRKRTKYEKIRLDCGP